jgi:hypothetical protein
MVMIADRPMPATLPSGVGAAAFPAGLAKR